MAHLSWYSFFRDPYALEPHITLISLFVLNQTMLLAVSLLWIFYSGNNKSVAYLKKSYTLD